MSISLEEAQKILEDHGQLHVLKFWERLDAGGRKSLLDQVGSLDLAAVAGMQDMPASKAGVAGKTDIEPAKTIALSGSSLEEAVVEGGKALSSGEVGIVLVAGGQGSRLGFDGPKGCFPLGPVSGLSLFAIHSRKILALEKRFSAEIPFYIMTSRDNDEATREFFVQQEYFGLSKDRVSFFMQGMLPALQEDGRLVLDRPDHIFVSPDGHGGTLAALRVNGMLDDMQARGIKTLFYFQVDNPLVEIADPAFVGIHRKEGAQVSVKVCAKTGPDEGLGVVVRRGDRTAVVEYTELTEEQKHETLSDGRLKFLFGSVAIHVFSLDFLKQEAGADLPLHTAHKKVPYCDEDGETIQPEEPNAYKFERFIFDTLPHAFRLPTDIEWIVVASCGDSRIYPWGNSWPPKYGNYSDIAARKNLPDWRGIRQYNDGFVVTCPVTVSGSNEWGIYGLAGNVWEWCEDWYGRSKRYKVRHGSSWDFDGQNSATIRTRGFDKPSASFNTIGFRVVLGVKK